ncbi:unnamed protein product [Phytomonas sp. EM1]|nr:unnamed protein product [Phytomonas sp. EM1]|eukprot:CCW60227.1 unnamed protein product [Phytomonas sp. isolate EM1]
MSPTKPKENNPHNGISIPGEERPNRSPVEIHHNYPPAMAEPNPSSETGERGGTANETTARKAHKNYPFLDHCDPRASPKPASPLRFSKISAPPTSARNGEFMYSIFSFHSILRRFQGLECTKRNDVMANMLLDLDPMSMPLVSAKNAHPSEMVLHTINASSTSTAKGTFLPVVTPRENLHNFALESYLRRHGKPLKFHSFEDEPKHRRSLQKGNLTASMGRPSFGKEAAVYSIPLLEENVHQPASGAGSTAKKSSEKTVPSLMMPLEGVKGELQPVSLGLTHSNSSPPDGSTVLSVGSDSNNICEKSVVFDVNERGNPVSKKQTTPHRSPFEVGFTPTKMCSSNTPREAFHPLQLHLTGVSNSLK